MTPTGEPAFSVVVPCRDERAALARCLDALAAQDFPPGRVEIIVVDGGSGDGSDALARARGVRVLRDGGHGPSGARNEGIRAALAPLVAFTDADCVPRADWLTSLAEVFAEDPGLAGVAGGIRLRRDTLLGVAEDADARACYRGFITSNVAYRRDVLLEVGGFDEDLDCAEDYDLAWRVLDAGHRVVHDPRPVVTHEPPELASLLAYLKKQAWYARHDLPAHLRALGRARRDADAWGSANALPSIAGSARDALWTATLATGLLARAPLLAAAGAAGAGAAAARRAWRIAREAGEPPRMVPVLAAVGAAKALARGAGTLQGLADLARPSVRARLRRGARASMAPSAPAPPPPPSRPRAASGG